MSHPERIVPDETSRGIVALHLKRYEFAAEHAAGADVLDAGCGVGYGAAYLAERARAVVGVDVDPRAVAYARERYTRPNLRFETADLHELGLDDESFDLVCCFETIEHLAKPDRFLGHVVRVLRPEGLLIASTPRAAEATERPENPYHEREYTPAELERLLRGFFGAVRLYGQRRRQTRRHRALQRVDVLGLRRRLPVLRPASRLLGTPPTVDVGLEDVVIAEHGIDDAAEVVAVCSRPLKP